jgi:S-adenosylmethionine synthetase
MAVRCADSAEVTAACAMIGRFLTNIDDYVEQKAAFAARELAIEHGLFACNVTINAADDVSSGSVYLTVTGTSAEAGDLQHPRNGNCGDTGLGHSGDRVRSMPDGQQDRHTRVLAGIGGNQAG